MAKASGVSLICEGVNVRGTPANLVASHPGNTNAAKSGIYSPQLQAKRAAEIEARSAGLSTFELAQAATIDERKRLHVLLAVLDHDIEAHGVSTKAGSSRRQVTQRSNVARQLQILADATWSPRTGVDVVAPRNHLAADAVEAEGDGVGTTGVSDDLAHLRAELFGLLATRDALDDDLAHRGVSTQRGGERRQVLQRLRLSRDLIDLSVRLRAQVMRSGGTGDASVRSIDVAREIAFGPGHPVPDRLRALEHLLVSRAPPPENEFKARLRAASSEELTAVSARLGAEDACDDSSDGHPNVTSDDPTDGVDARVQALALLADIARGALPGANGSHRLQAARLYEKFAPPPGSFLTVGGDLLVDRRGARMGISPWLRSGSDCRDFRIGDRPGIVVAERSVQLSARGL